MGQSQWTTCAKGVQVVTPTLVGRGVPLACGGAPRPGGDVSVLLYGSFANPGHEVSLLVYCLATFGKGLAVFDDGPS